MKTLRRLTLLGIVLLEAGCGLPDTYFLQQPTVVTLAPGPGYFQFSNPIHDLNHDINVNFTGDELYYKFYSDPANIDQNVYDSNSASDVSVQLAAKGFIPVYLSTDSPSNRHVPLISINTALAQAGSTVVVSIYPNLTTISSFSITSGPSGEIRRSVVDPSTGTTYKTFVTNSYLSNNYLATDPDINSGYIGTGTVYIAMYAVSYGLVGISTPQRSVPTYLGYQALTPFS